MKRFILLPFTFLLFLTLHAQQKKFIVRQGIGYITGTHVGEALFNSFGTVVISFFVKHDFRIATSGAFTTDALYLFERKKMRAGLSYAHEKITITEYNNNEATTHLHTVNSLMPEWQYNYILKKNINLYSGVALGLRLDSYSNETSKRNSASMAFHFTFVGFSFGKTVSAFTEIGYGAKGLVRGGVALAF